jgi:DNA modification methylase
MSKVILNKTKSCQSIPWQELKGYEFNGLKEADGRDVTKLKASIVNDGFIFPMFIWAGHKFVIDGAGRDKALMELEAEGYEIEGIPVVEIEAENKRMAKLLTLQASSRYGGVTKESYEDFTLDMELVDFDLARFDLGVDFDLVEVEELAPCLTDPDEVPEPPKEPITKMGDVWLLGDHRVMAGDSTVITDVDRLLNGQKAQLLHADPPYGMKKENEGVLNDNLNSGDLCQFQMDCWNTYRSHLVDNASAYIWGNTENLWKLWYVGGLKDSERLTMRNEIVWGKKCGMGIASGGLRMYPTVSERCLFFMLGEQGFNNNADNYCEGWEPIRKYLEEERIKTGWSVPDMKRAVGHSDLSRDHWTSKSQWSFPTEDVYKKMQKAANNDAFKKDYDELKKEFYSTRAYFDNTHENMTDVWDFPRVSGEERYGHATPKPVDMMARIMKSSLPKGGLCLEPFGGSGSTLIGAETTGRKCYTMELDPRYVDVIVTRWQELTGKKATHEESGEEFNDMEVRR